MCLGRIAGHRIGCAYDPRPISDRLLLGLKGTMSENELSLMRQRGIAARDSKAQRGEFQFMLHPGFCWAAATVKAIDAIFEIEREINGRSPDERLAIRQERSRPLVVDLETRLRADRTQLSPKNNTARAIDYMEKRWPAFTRFLDDGRLCLSNNAAERAVRSIALGRKNWTFAGSDAGGRRAAAMYTLIETAKLNDVDPTAWLADVLARLPGHLAREIDNL